MTADTGPEPPASAEASGVVPPVVSTDPDSGWMATLQVVTMASERCRVPGWSGSVTLTIQEPDRRLQVYEAGSGEDMFPTGAFLASLGGPPPWWPVAAQVKQVLDRCPDAPIGDLLRFVSSSQAKRRAAAEASGKDTPVWLGWALAGDPVFQHARFWVNRLPREDPVFEAMLRHLIVSDDRLRILAMNRVGDDMHLIDLAIGSSDRDQWLWAARNSHTPTEWLSRIARVGIDDEEVCLRLARDQSLDAETATILQGTPWWSVRYAVARNKGTPESVWRGLLGDPDLRVAHGAWIRAWEEWPVEARHGPAYRAFAAAWHQWKFVTYGTPLPDPDYDGEGQW